MYFQAFDSMLFTMNTRNLIDQARLELHRINVAMCAAHGGRKPNKGHFQVLHAPFVPFVQSIWMVIDLSVKFGVIAVIRHGSLSPKRCVNNAVSFI